jgi:hypothetical protein
MKITDRMADHAHGIFFGGNWTSVTLQDILTDLTFEEATKQVHQLNTIASLTYHVGYFVHELQKMINGAPLEAKDKLSWEGPEVNSEATWQQLREEVLGNAAHLVTAIRSMPENRTWEFLGDEKYGDFYYNIHGIIEHSHYHLGQMAVIKKMIRQDTIVS